MRARDSKKKNANKSSPNRDLVAINVKIENVLVRLLPLTGKILVTEEVTRFCDKSFKPEKNSTNSFVNIHLYQVFIRSGSQRQILSSFLIAMGDNFHM